MSNIVSIAAINVATTNAFLAALATRANSAGTVSRSDAGDAASSVGLPFPRWFANGDTFRQARGQFRIPTLAECQSLGLGFGEPSKRGRKPGTTVVKASKPRAVKSDAPSVVQPPTFKSSSPSDVVTMSALVKDDSANNSMQATISKALGVDVLLGSEESIPFVPTVNKNYVPWGHFEDIKTLISSGHFLPVMVVGPSGNGKTDMLEQVCAVLGREYVRVNITNQTDEDDLLGGFRLVNGETKFALGPIPVAMLRGAVVNLDEVDLGGAALMCLQPVLEGKPLYLKKIGRYIHPAPGFTIGATANTKGRGDDGKYAHTTIMNEAMLERFAVMFEQGWADAPTERKIVGNVLKSYGKYDATLAKHLVEFAAVTRNNFDQQICNDQIATRRLLHMVRVFCALGDLDKAITVTLSRFDADTAAAFKNLWNAIHEDPKATSPSGTAVPVEPAQSPF
jgi:hypothetical protein